MRSIQNDDNKSLRQLIREDPLWRALRFPDKTVGTFNYYLMFDIKRKRNADKIKLRDYCLIQLLLRRRRLGYWPKISMAGLRLFGEMSRWKIWER